MLDYQRIVDDARGALAMASSENGDLLRQVAADYLVACDEVNERLRKCGNLLKKGLRSEAIQLCEIDPNLLDLVATLDFPEQDTWNQILAHRGLAASPPLLIDVAADLNEAYAIEQPLAALLQQHRLFALARSPLEVRIRTLRELAKLDANNPLWRDDLQSFERERHKQIQKQIGEAAHARNLDMLTTVVAELKDNGWLEPPPKSLVDWATQERRELTRLQAREELEKIEPQLSAAYSEFDVARGRELRALWIACAQAAAVGVGHPLVERAQPALDWLEQQDEQERREAAYVEAIQALERAIDQRQPLEVLERRYNAAESLGEIPEDLMRRLEERTAVAHRAERRRGQLIIAGSIAGVALAAGLVTWGVFYGLHRAEVQRQVATIQRNLDENRPGDARKLVEDLEQNAPSIAASDEIQRLKLQTDNQLKKEDERITEFAKTLDQLAEVVGDPPSKLVLRARQLAKTETERGRLLKVENEIAVARTAAQAERDQKANAALDGIEQRIAKMETDRSINGQENSIKSVAQDLAPLSKRADDVSDAVHERAIKLGDRVREIQKTLDQRNQEERLLSQVTQSIGDLTTYREALSRYSKEFPATARSKDFNRVVVDLSLAEGLAKWNEVLSGWQELSTAQMGPAKSAALTTLAATALDKYGRYSFAEPVAKRLPYLKAIARREEDGKPISAKLDRLFQDALVADVWMIEDKKGRRLYLKSNPRLATGKLTTVSYVVGFDLTEKKKGYKLEDVARSAQAPQVIVARTINKTLEKLNDANWEESFCNMIKIVEEDSQIDPILRLNLLDQTLQVGCQGSLVLQIVFADHLQALKRSTVNPFANWLDPDDEPANESRTKCESVLSELPKLTKEAELVAKELADFRQPPGVQTQWVGWLRRGNNTAWECSVSKANELSGKLLVVRRRDSGSIELAPIGQQTRGHIKLDSAKGEKLFEGEPVYLDASTNQ